MFGLLVYTVVFKVLNKEGLIISDDISVSCLPATS